MSDKKEQAVSELTIKEKKYLKGLAHPLSPVVKIGKEGLTENVFTTIETELLHHELIKVKIGSNSAVNKTAAAEQLPGKTASSLVQLIGKTIILYKANPKKRKDKRIILKTG
ncbi:MAG: ribosome assembly RNA-binding protein YhbY [Deltaproteobacteria bacterium]|nr:ribosome assembly RNA-binding protein YhbY [Deltaproteobacteria bacterium]MBW2659969.1 ribosome assembly RNA-binding protein YhbY [Deltaproteobacteria bacterium]